MVMSRRKKEEGRTPLNRGGGKKQQGKRRDKEKEDDNDRSSSHVEDDQGKRRWDMMMSPFSAVASGGDWFREFYNMRREMESIFEETLRDIEQVPKELVREHENSEGAKVREVGPLVYGYSYTVGSDGKPQFREFGNVRPFGSESGRSSSGHHMLRGQGEGRRSTNTTAPMLTSERQPMADVTEDDKEIKVTVEMPGITKQDIKVKVQDGSVEIWTAENAKRKYYRAIEIPSEADFENAKSTYSNGILEITFKKRSKPEGREIQVD